MKNYSLTSRPTLLHSQLRCIAELSYTIKHSIMKNGLTIANQIKSFFPESESALIVERAKDRQSSTRKPS